MMNPNNHANLRPELKEKIRNWLISFYHLDPRYNILRFFNLVASEGADNLTQDNVEDDSYNLDRGVSTLSLQRDSSGSYYIEKPNPFQNRPSAANLRPSTKQLLANIFDVTSILTVWRPTSNDAMRKMMLGVGVGKGLDIKGKSAKCGQLSGYVPFLQIHNNDHKTKILPIPQSADLRVYYPTQKQRDYVFQYLQDFLEKQQQQRNENDNTNNNNTSITFIDETKMHFNTTPTSSSSKIPTRMKKIDKYCTKSWFGLELSQRLFWNCMIKPSNIERTTPSTKIGRPSTPGFQDANLKTLKVACSTKPRPNPMPVIVQTLKYECDEGDDHQEQGGDNENNTDDDDDANDPSTIDDKNESPSPSDLCSTSLDVLHLVMAYEENNTITPVVSDFDGFLLGWRREALWFGCNLPRDQEDLMLWSIDKIEEILEEQKMNPHNTDTWTIRWLDILKKETQQHQNGNKNFHPTIPEYGFGDPKSYSIMEQAALRLKHTGAPVRHGSECFNYYFPQEIDDTFLLISDTLRPVQWRYVNVKELQSILAEKIKEGFVFPLNPKWILCDPGWKHLYDLLMASDALYADLSKDVWYPPFSGVRQRIENIHARHTNGFIPPKGKVNRRASVIIDNTNNDNNDTGYSPLRENLHDGEEISGNTAFDLAELELDDYVRHSVKLTLARQIKEAHLDDLWEEDDEDGNDESEHKISADSTGIVVDDDDDEGISRRNGTDMMYNSDSGKSLGKHSAHSVDSGMRKVNGGRGLFGEMSKRTLFRTQRQLQKRAEPRYRSSDNQDMFEDQDEVDPELAEAKNDVNRKSLSVEDDYIENSNRGSLRIKSTPTRPNPFDSPPPPPHHHRHHTDAGVLTTADPRKRLSKKSPEKNHKRIMSEIIGSEDDDQHII